MLRISVSDLDCYRRYKQMEDVTLEECLAQLRRETPPSPSMLAGRALHSILENAESEDLESVSLKRDGYHFTFDCDITLALPSVRELKGEAEIQTPSGPVTLVGVVDGLDRSIYDYKLTGRFDAERFADSYQWRCYLYMFHVDRFVYRVFVGQEKGTGRGFDGEVFAEWVIREYHELPVYRYPGMEQDVINEVSEFAAFLTEHMLAEAA
jgi:hypothetical protein